MNIHMVHSFKGGCGKTTVALSLVAELGKTNEKETKRKVILVDMDLKGSGLEAILYQGDLGLQSGREATIPLRWHKKTYVGDGVGTIKIVRSEYHLTDYFTNWRYREHSVSPGDCIWNMSFNTFSADIMVASMEQRKKRILYIGNESGGLELDLFRYRFERLLDYLNTQQYTDIVLDMPPSSDEYVEEVNRVLFPANKKNIHPWIVNLYYITTTDTSNLAAAGEYLNYLFFGSMSRSLPDNTTIVLNDLYKRVQPFLASTDTNPDTKMLYDYLKSGKSSKLNNLFENLWAFINKRAVNSSEDSGAGECKFVFVPFNDEFQNEMSNYLQSSDTFLSLDALRNQPVVAKESSDWFTWNLKYHAPSLIPISKNDLKEHPKDYQEVLLKNYIQQ